MLAKVRAIPVKNLQRGRGELFEGIVSRIESVMFYRYSAGCFFTFVKLLPYRF